MSIIIPCLNEEGFIRRAIESLLDDYFREYCELIVVDGMSDDGTRAVIESFIEKGLRIRIFENRDRTQAFGLNLGIKKAEGEIIVRADAHCVYPTDYIKNCIELLMETGAANVGGVMLPEGIDDGQKAIAWAFRHPVGVGNARWHLSHYRGFVDTVYLGVFRKELFDEIGLYDTNCKTNEDAELNLRILKAGKKIYLDSSIDVVYYPRESFPKLARQYFFYGKGRAYTTLKHKKLTSWRQAAPVVLVIGLAASIGLGFWQPAFFLVPATYLGYLVVIAQLSWRKRGGSGSGLGSEKKISVKQRFLIAAAWAVMHVCWGVGFVAHCMSRLREKKDEKRYS